MNEVKSDFGKSGWVIAVSNCGDGLVAVVGSVVEEEDEVRSSGMATEISRLEMLAEAED